jgi:hypothetical protein
VAAFAIGFRFVIRSDAYFRFVRAIVSDEILRRRAYWQSLEQNGFFARLQRVAGAPHSIHGGIDVGSIRRL